MSILVGQLVREVARFSECFASLMGMKLPDGSEYEQYRGYNTPMGWNQIARHLLESKHEYLFTTNDDHVYPQDTVMRLMSHKKEAVTGLYLLRQYPFEPVIYDTEHEKVTVDGGRVPTGMSHRYLQNGETGLVKILTCGDGALLLHRSVFERIPGPYWYELNGPPAPPDQINCDVLFAKKLRDNGIDIWCDLDVRIGHIACVPVYPVCRDGQWFTALAQGNGMAIDLPAATPWMRPQMEENLRQVNAAKKPAEAK